MHVGDSVISPKIDEVFKEAIVPEKPVKFKFRIEEGLDTTLKVYVPVVMLKDMLFASDVEFGVIVVATEPEYFRLITGVPETLYVASPVYTFPDDNREIVFVPKANVPVYPVIVSV